MSKKLFVVAHIKKLENTVVPNDDGTSSTFARWSISEFPEGSKQSTGSDASFAIISLPEGSTCPIQVGQIAECQLRAFLTAEKLEAENYFWFRTHSNMNALRATKKVNAELRNMADEERYANLEYHRELRSLGNKMAQDLPDSVITGG